MTLGAKPRSFKDAPAHTQLAALKIMGGLTCVGYLVLIAAGLWYWNQQRFIQASNPAKAEVLRVDVVTNHSDGTTTRTYSPTFRFTDENGQTHTATPWYSSSDWGFGEGRTINIRYRRDRPQDAFPWGYADRIFGLPVFMVVMLSIGGAFSLLGTAGFISGYRSYRSAKARDASVADEDSPQLPEPTASTAGNGHRRPVRQ